MSIIQTIREKGTVIVIAVIAISLIGFILMDSASTTGSVFGSGNSTTVGSVNGENIEMFDFNKKVDEMEQQYGGSGQRNQIMQSVWEQMVAEKIVEEQFENLGLTFTPNEMSATMFSDDAPQQLKQAFTNPETGQYDIEQAKQWWAQTKQNRNAEQRNAIISQVIDPMRLNSLYTKYTSLISGSIYQPKWLTAQQQEEGNRFAQISYVAIPYSLVSDSAVTVTDSDIKKYLDQHKLQFEQEAGLMMSYVSFSAAANSGDSTRIRQSLSELKTEFVADSNARFFLGKHASAIPMFEAYTPVSKMQMPYKDSIVALSNGQVFGPYEDGNNYVIAKKVDTKMLPDSITSRHILLGTMDPQTQQPLLPDTTAKRLADSIATAIAGGADFNTLEQKYSTDQAAKLDNGVMTFDLVTIQGEGFAKEFGDFLLNEKGETKKVVQTQFGYHYIEILGKKGIQPAYKIAYMAREIAPSDETINAANAAANTLSGSARDAKAFNDYLQKNGLNKVTVPGVVKENDFQLGGVADAREVVRWAIKAKEGEVSEPFNIGEDFIVAVVDRKVKKGVPDPATARPMVETMVRNKKKAEIINKKLNNATTLEAAAQAYNMQVLATGEDSTLTFQSQIINGIGNEPKIAGASFNKEFQAKVSPPIAGNTGVFVIKVNSVGTKPGLSPEMIEQQKTAQISSMIQAALGQSFNALKTIAEIEDDRSKFF